MITVGILDTKGIGHCPSLEAFFSKKEKERLEKTRNEKVRSLSFFSRLLLTRMYEEKKCKKLPQISYTEEGKPYFENGECSFSISHDKDLVAVVLSEEDVGIDIQSFSREKDVRENLEKRFFSGVFEDIKKYEDFDIDIVFFEVSSEKEIFSLKTCEKKLQLGYENEENKEFLLRWTRLESMLKLVGCGFKGFKEVNNYLQKINFKTCFFQHGGLPVALSVASYKKQITNK